MSPIERLIRNLRGELDKIDAANLTSMAKSFDRNVYKALQGDIDALMKLLKLEQMGANVRNTAEFKRLIARVTDRLAAWESYMTFTVPQVASVGIAMGADAAGELVASYNLDATFRKLNPAAIEKLLGYLDENSALFQRIKAMSGYYADVVKEAILQGVLSGKNPNTIAELITRHLGMALTDSMRMVRTVQVWSYREANRASYIANSDVVEGWIWYATLDNECCMSCVAQHGTFHTNDEVLDDHYNGHCAMIPKVVKGDPGIGLGVDWFAGLPEEKQRELMGDGKFEAWQNGKFTLDQLSSQRHDDVYGSMRTETSLKDLIGE